jgi:molybdate transport repressor ModE-like protein
MARVLILRVSPSGEFGAMSSRSAKHSSEAAADHPPGRRRRCPGSAGWGDRLRARAVLIVDQDGEKVLGPRFVRLLEEIDAQGSVRRAALALGLGYRHAVAWIVRAEAAFDRPLVVRRSGGPAGGGSELTQEGMRLVRSYRRVSKTLSRIAQQAREEILGRGE